MVEIVETSIILPLEETPKHSLWLSNLDLVFNWGHTPTLYLYRSSGHLSSFSNSSTIETLKSALSKALIPFYPFAGRLNRDSSGRLEVNCNGQGVVFVVARSEIESDWFADFRPSDEGRKMFVPVSDESDEKRPLLMVQVTFLKCGGVVLGSAMDHALADGPTALHFLQTWARIARGESINITQPFLDRTLLLARNPPKPLYEHTEYSQTLRTDLGHNKPNQYVTGVFKLSNDQVASLKSRCGSGPISTYIAVAAHVWKCTCKSQELPEGTEARMLLPADVRARLEPSLPKNFLGNAVVFVAAAANVSDMVSDSSNAYLAERIKGAIGRVNDGYVRSLIDYLEKVDIATMSPNGQVDRFDLRVVSWLGMPMYEIDFGWGAPQFVARADMLDGRIVYLLKNTGKDEGISVIVSLDATSLQRFKKIFYENISHLEKE
ncbi:hypothetical protein LUZ60_001024 [Juncus effusus]|nr:hypothetical protein LUZ60_001024 [Juncus effusus]